MTVNHSSTETLRHWAKSDRENPNRIHLLEHHLADVGACLEEILKQETVRKRLARAGGLNDLDDITIARLCVFAALHDIGKVNLGFQTQIWPRGLWPRGVRRAGHTLDLTPILRGDDRDSMWFFDSLGWEEMLTWDDRGGETVCDLMIAALSHHGMPLNLHSATPQANSAIWRDFGKLKPRECVESVARLLRTKWFSAAFSEDASPLPSAPAFQHHFLGLLILADWIGSNEKWFEYVSEYDENYIEKARSRARHAVSQIGLNLTEQRSQFSVVPTFKKLFGFDKPNAMQKIASDASSDRLNSEIVIIESETGSGKTEAALMRFAQMYNADLVDGMYFALPTRSAASQIWKRVRRFTKNLYPAKAPDVTLAVPGYLHRAQKHGLGLQDYPVWWDNSYHDDTAWAAENPKRYLAAQIAVGTVDQAMMGALRIKHSHLRAACLSRNLLVVDEVHASDRYMSEILAALLRIHTGAGGYALLMSATLGSVARARWLPGAETPALDESIKAPYPVISFSGDGEILSPGESGQNKSVRVSSRPIMSDFDAVASLALEAAVSGTKVLVVRNTVDYAIRTQQALERVASNEERDPLFSLNGVPTLHHGRFAVADRRELDSRIENLLGNPRPPGGLVVVGTQTLEQSLDIDADLLITDLCPADVLLQRIGRLHRHSANDPNRPDGYSTPSCVALTPSDGDLSPLLKSGLNANGLGPKGHVYEDLRILEATRRLIAKYPDWRIPDMNRELVERSTHPDALESIAREMGDDWMAHSLEIEGAAIGDSSTAQRSIVRHDKRFYGDNGDLLFPGGDEEKIRTRLGDDRIDIEIESPRASPLGTGKPIDGLAVSKSWLSDGPLPESVETAKTDEGGFVFSIGERRFRYDRLGLQRLK